MPAGIAVVRCDECRAHDVAAHSRNALDAPLAGLALLRISSIQDVALLVGAFQRGAGFSDAWPLFRRGSGGPEVLVGPGTVHVALSLPHPGALIGADPKRIVNRAVRPLLRALSRIGATAHFFGRDWVSVGQRPAAWVGFAHDTSTGRTLFEAFIAVRNPFAIAQRPSFRGRAHATLEEVVKRNVDPADLATAIIDAYVEGHERMNVDPPAPALSPGPPNLRHEPPWTATCEEAIGWLGAGPDERGVFRVGGDLLVSRDALSRLEEQIAALPPDASAVALGRVVDESLGAPHVALEGIRTLSSVRDLIARARGVSCVPIRGHP
jgi:lipoate-protein ligase A